MDFKCLQCVRLFQKGTPLALAITNSTVRALCEYADWGVEDEKGEAQGVVASQVQTVLVDGEDDTLLRRIKLRGVNKRSLKHICATLSLCTWWLKRDVRPLEIHLDCRNAAVLTALVQRVREFSDHLEECAVPHRIHLSLYGAPSVESVAVLSQHLEALLLEQCRVENLEGLKECRLLKRLSIGRCYHLRSFDGVSCLSNLEYLHVSDCYVKRLGEVRLCTSLQHLSLLHCMEMSSLAGVEGLPSLRTITVNRTSIDSLEDIKDCDKLSSVDARYCNQLRALPNANRLSTLHTLNVKGSAMSSLDDLGPSESLRVLNAGDCTLLESLRGLFSCPFITTVCVSGSVRLRSLREFSALEFLTSIDASDSRIETVGSLRGCTRLEKIDLSGCYYLRSLGRLRGSPVAPVCVCPTVHHHFTRGTEGLPFSSGGPRAQLSGAHHARWT
ncbi:hypothetical protein ADEAN_000278100 [Angomonas deanei]|uniref:Leucine Rich repeat n=1 Tax=Angomonas deanei TaxID=59799 RepID=A0A7G2C6E0_9TRYP|nr:hypothetical protein ADEAN_000278100 [Angomonas deanei]